MQVWVRTRVLPWVMWAGTMTGVAWLWLDVHDEGAAVGFAAGVEYVIAPAQPGRIASLVVAPGQRVHAGEVVAVLATDTVAAERALLAAERERLEAELGAVRSDTALRTSATARGFDESIAAADLALQSARAERRVRAAESAALKAQADALAGLVAARMADRRELDALRVKRAAVEKQVEAADGLIHELVHQAAAARSRRAALPVDATELALRPLRAELAVLAGREQLLALRDEEAVLRAPADGEVAAVHLRPGEFAAAGAPVVTLVDRGPGPDDEIVVCMREDQAARVRPGEAVSLRGRSRGGAAVAGHVTRVGPRITELPPRCRRDPAIAEWGREVTVALDERAPLLPGQAFSVAFLGQPSPCLDPPPTRDDAPAAGDEPVAAAPRIEEPSWPAR